MTLCPKGLFVSLISVLPIIAAACSDEEESAPFIFDVVLNNYSSNEVKILVDGETVAASEQMIALGPRMFESYDDALSTPIRIETQRDGNTLETCNLYPGVAVTCAFQHASLHRYAYSATGEFD